MSLMVSMKDRCVRDPIVEGTGKQVAGLGCRAEIAP